MFKKLRTGMNNSLALLCWIVAGIITLFSGLCYAELGAAMPRAGGRVVYLNEAYHPIVGFMTGFSEWVIGGPGSIAALSLALMEVLRTFFPLHGFGLKISAVVLIIAVTFYNLYGVKLASAVQSVSMIAKLIPIAIILIAALLIGRVSPDLSFASANVYAKEHNTSIFAMMAIAIVAALWAYDGWTNLNIVTEEMREPHKNLPLALIIGIGGVTVLYTLFNFAILKVLPHEEIVSMIDAGELYLGTAVAKKILGNAGAIVVSVGMILSMFGCLNGLVLASPRMQYAMAKEGHFFKSFAKLHPKHKVPYVAIIVQCVFSCILVFASDLDKLTNYVIVSNMLFGVLTIFAVPILRKKYPTIARPYKVWFYPVSIIITALIYIALFVQAAIEDPINGLIGIGFPAMGAVTYFIFDRINHRTKNEEKEES